MRKTVPDVLVVGAGIFGLAAAWACARRGLRVLVTEAGTVGAGASGGIVGALSPHPPERWSAKKAFQLDALLAADGWWGAVAVAGGRDPGYARTGRLVPLATPREVALAEARAVEAALRWPAPHGWRWIEPGRLPGWLSPEAARHGAVHDSLAARLHPRRALDALAAAIAARGGEIRTGWPALALQEGGVAFAEGCIRARHVILAAGTGTPALLEGAPVSGTKGQAMLLAGGIAPGTPMVTVGDILLVPHADGTVAIGSTTEAGAADPKGTDGRLDVLRARAVALCPALGPARVIERWAGLRPRGPRPDPMLGPVPGRPGLLLATGGYKIGFGLAPAVGEALADMVSGVDPNLPPGFAAADQMAAGPAA